MKAITGAIETNICAEGAAAAGLSVQQLWLVLRALGGLQRHRGA
jgi:hypothetical protein